MKISTPAPDQVYKNVLLKRQKGLENLNNTSNNISPLAIHEEPKIQPIKYIFEAQVNHSTVLLLSQCQKSNSYRNRHFWNFTNLFYEKLPAEIEHIFENIVNMAASDISTPLPKNSSGHPFQNSSSNLPSPSQKLILQILKKFLEQTFKNKMNFSSKNLFKNFYESLLNENLLETLNNQHVNLQVQNLKQLAANLAETSTVTSTTEKSASPRKKLRENSSKTENLAKNLAKSIEDLLENKLFLNYQNNNLDKFLGGNLSVTNSSENYGNIFENLNYLENLDVNKIAEGKHPLGQKSGQTSSNLDNFSKNYKTNQKTIILAAIEKASNAKNFSSEGINFLSQNGIDISGKIRPNNFTILGSDAGQRADAQSKNGPENAKTMKPENVKLGQNLDTKNLDTADNIYTKNLKISKKFKNDTRFESVLELIDTLRKIHVNYPILVNNLPENELAEKREYFLFYAAEKYLR